jgi:hypothetical protein
MREVKREAWVGLKMLFTTSWWQQENNCSIHLHKF